MRAVSRGVVGRIAVFGIAALGPCAVDVDPSVVHISHRLAKRHVRGILPSTQPVCVRGTTPVEGVVRTAVLDGDGRGVEHRIDGRRIRRRRRPRVVDNALQLFGIGQPPVVVTKIVLVIFLLDLRQGVLPVHAAAAVVLRPHQFSRVVRDCAIAVVCELVRAVIHVATDKVGVKRLVGSEQRQAVAFDATVGEIDAEHHRAPVGHRIADVQGAGSHLGVDDPFARAGVAVAELEIFRIDKRNQP